MRSDLVKLLVISQYFWPENFRINDLVADLVRRGHEVTVLTGKPNYPDGRVFADYAANPGAFLHHAGARIVRVPMLARGKGGVRLALNYLSFAASASLMGLVRLWREPFDAIFVFEPSPITVGLPALALKWRSGAPIAFWVLDLWPQSLKAVGMVASRTILRLVAMLVAMIYRGSDLVLAQSRSFIPEIGKYLPDPDRIRYFPSWSDEAPAGDADETVIDLPVATGDFDIMFAGNIGAAQDFPAILDAAELLREDAVRWLIVGDGRTSDWVKQEIAQRGLTDRVLMLGRHPLAHMPAFFRRADALLISLRSEPIFSLTIPGKLQAYLAAGRPILAMLNGEGAEVVQTARAGLTTGAGDAAGLASAVRQMLATSPADRAEMGRRGRDYSLREFNRDELITRLEQWLIELAASHHRKPQ
jgi:glycosyltransferase involved in cell wall biosynthesis